MVSNKKVGDRQSCHYSSAGRSRMQSPVENVWCVGECRTLWKNEQLKASRGRRDIGMEVDNLIYAGEF
jgi:hypothetical protein